MPNYFMYGLYLPEFPRLPLIMSNSRELNEGPPPGFINQHFTLQFVNFAYSSIPHIQATTGNPHWTAHPIWANSGAAGFVVNQKSPSPGGRVFSVYVQAIGYVNVLRKAGFKPPEMHINEVSEEEFERLRSEAS